MKGTEITGTELRNKCKVCEQVGHFFVHCCVPHFACKEGACYVPDTHKNYKLYPCPMAQLFLD